TYFATKLYDNFLDNPVLLAAPVLAVLALLGIKVFASRGLYLKAFYSSCATIVTITLTGVIGLFPNLIPSSMDPRYSLTIFNSSSSIYTLKIMTAVALVFVPVVIAYQLWVYRTFRQKLNSEEVLSDNSAY
ncbi:MAG TPA: cytochrome d ubiquinol oxidase subunit II, partial [Dissulfurispiraceae bacterium]